MEAGRRLYARGIALSASGIVVLSPDGLLLRLIGEAGTMEVIFYRALFMGISLALVLAVKHRSPGVGVWRGMGGVIVLSAGLIAFANIAFVGAIVQTTVANTLVILATMPLFSAVLGRMLIGEAVRLRTWISISVAIAGMAVIFADSLGGGSWPGDLLALVAAALYGLNLVVLRRWGEHVMMPALGLSGFIGAALIWPWAAPATVGTHDLVVLGVLGLALLPLGMALFFSGTRYAPAAEVALVSLLEAVLGPLWVWLVIGERPAPLALAGAAVVLGAVAVNAALALRR